jgi:hypothetical protein
VKSLLLFSIVIVGTSCTTLENRRDLYRSPAEGYERWYRRPPPTASLRARQCRRVKFQPARSNATA